MGDSPIAPGARLEATRCSERVIERSSRRSTAALSTARSAEKSRATVAARDLRSQVHCFLDKSGGEPYQEHRTEMRAERRERLPISCRRCVSLTGSRQPAV